MERLFSTKLNIWFATISLGWVLIIFYSWYFIAVEGCGISVYSCNKSWAEIDPEVWRFLGYYIGTLGVGPVGLYLLTVRTKAAGMQLENEQKKLRIEGEKIQNDRFKAENDTFAKSIELLGNADIVVRQGAIFALSTIAKNDPKSKHAIIFKILISFVRSKSIEFLKTKEFLNKKIVANTNQQINCDGSQESNYSAEKIKLTILKNSETLPADVESALDIIRNRDVVDYEKNKHSDAKERRAKDPAVGRGYLFDMSNAYFLNIDLDEANFDGFNLSNAFFEGCGFIKTQFKYTFLVKAEFRAVNLKESDFSGADLKGADFSGREKDLDSEDLLQNCCDLRTVIGLTGEQIATAIGNEYTLLPNDIKRPESWGEQIKIT